MRSGTSNLSITDRGVGWLTSTTFAVDQPPIGAGKLSGRGRPSCPGSAGRPAGADPTACPAAAISVTLVPLFQPWVTPVVVAVALPESLLVMIHQGDPGDPFCALPEVQVRHQQPYRPAVIGRQWLALMRPHDPGLAPRDVRERQIRRVAGGRGGHDEARGRSRPRRLEQCVDADPGEAGRQLGPGSDAMD